MLMDLINCFLHVYFSLYTRHYEYYIIDYLDVILFLNSVYFVTILFILSDLLLIWQLIYLHNLSTFEGFKKNLS